MLLNLLCSFFLFLVFSSSLAMSLLALTINSYSFIILIMTVAVIAVPLSVVYSCCFLILCRCHAPTDYRGSSKAPFRKVGSPQQQTTMKLVSILWKPGLLFSVSGCGTFERLVCFVCFHDSFLISSCSAGLIKGMLSLREHIPLFQLSFFRFTDLSRKSAAGALGLEFAVPCCSLRKDPPTGAQDTSASVVS